MNLGDRMQINMVMRVDHKESERPMTLRNGYERSGASPQSVYMTAGLTKRQVRKRITVKT